jgi:hypothetical protein
MQIVRSSVPRWDCFVCAFHIMKKEHELSLLLGQIIVHKRHNIICKKIYYNWTTKKPIELKSAIDFIVKYIILDPFLKPHYFEKTAESVRSWTLF